MDVCGCVCMCVGVKCVHVLCSICTYACVLCVHLICQVVVWYEEET